MIRVIVRLDIKGPNLVKGVHFEGLRVLGKPEDFASKYYQDGADELIYIDSVASLYGRQNLLDIVRRAAADNFIPLTAGGGIRSIDDIRHLLRAGADKVAINTAAIRNPGFIKEAARVFGSQCIVISIQAKMREPGRYEAMTDNSREKSGKDVWDWAREAVDLGAGELLITSVDKEGTGRGFDLALIKKIAQSVPVPVIACGGAGKPEHFSELVLEARPDAVCAASIFHYHRLAALANADKFQAEGNVEFLKRSRDTIDFMKNRIQASSVIQVKEQLSSAGIACRMTGNVAHQIAL